jgi:hypothetical protein
MRSKMVGRQLATAARLLCLLGKGNPCCAERVAAIKQAVQISVRLGLSATQCVPYLQV